MILSILINLEVILKRVNDWDNADNTTPIVLLRSFINPFSNVKNVVYIHANQNTLKESLQIPRCNKFT